LQIWQRLASEWHLDGLAAITRSILLADIPTEAAAMLAGKTDGRCLVQPPNSVV